MQPRPVPQRTMPLVAAAVVVALALPVFLVAGWRVQGWALGAVLWAGSQTLGWVLTRLRTGTGNLAAAGVVAFGMMFRAVAVMIVVFVVAVSDPWLGVAAAAVYAAGYTTELALSLVSYFGGRPL
jgi:hypothetical protein